MPTPLTTIVVPTSNRPALLPVAVQSALDHSGPDVEVVVVPNGPDESWNSSLARFHGDSRVRIAPIAEPGANAARNHGLVVSRGKYVRFLDDDDYLLPDAQRQLEVLEASGADVCSGTVEKIVDGGESLGLMRQQDAHDLVCAMVRPGRVCLPLSHLFLRSSIFDRRWDEGLRHEQDTEWMFGLCGAREWAWAPIDAEVGCWRQHPGARTSGGIVDQDRARYTTRLLLGLRDQLTARGALGKARSKAIATALWDFAHSHFFRDPAYWHRVAKAALALDPSSRPADRFYASALGSALDPLLVEFLLVPHRIVRHWRERRQ